MTRGTLQGSSQIELALALGALLLYLFLAIKTQNG